MCTVLPLLKRPNGSSVPTSPTTTTLPPLSRLFLVYHRLCLSVWLWIPGSFSHLMFASLFFFFFSFLSHFWQTGKFQLSFLGMSQKQQLEKIINHLLEDMVGISGVWKKLKPLSSYYSFVQTMIPKLEMFFFLFLSPGIDHFNYGRADHNTGLNVWCFTFLFCP